MKNLFTALSLFGLLTAYPAAADAHFRPDDQPRLAAVHATTASALKAKPVKAAAKVQAVQLSAQDLAKMLEAQVLSGEGVSMKFKIKGGRERADENVTVVADVKTKKVRIETGSMTIVSDGQTVYNYQKRNNQLTIDALGKGLFLFATNYTAKLVSAKNGNYVLALTPNANVQNALTAAGGISQITFNLGVAKDKLNIKSASASSNGQNVETGALTVKSLKTMPASQFAFSAPKGARVIDLRE
jgi:outer membrane lipoprotein-sorting protein